MRRAWTWAALALLGVALLIGALFFWLGVPTLVLWTLSKLTSSSTKHFVLGMIFVPTGMAVFGLALAWLNDLYLRTRDALRGNVRGNSPRRSDGPLVPVLIAAAIISFGALVVWFLFLSQSAFPAAPGSNFIP